MGAWDIDWLVYGPPRPWDRTRDVLRTTIQPSNGAGCGLSNGAKRPGSVQVWTPYLNQRHRLGCQCHFLPLMAHCIEPRPVPDPSCLGETPE